MVASEPEVHLKNRLIFAEDLAGETEEGDQCRMNTPDIKLQLKLNADICAAIDKLVAARPDGSTDYPRSFEEFRVGSILSLHAGNRALLAVNAIIALIQRTQLASAPVQGGQQ